MSMNKALWKQIKPLLDKINPDYKKVKKDKLKEIEELA